MTGRNFLSDNVAPVHPEIMTAIARANDGPAMSYGADAISGRLDELVGTVFGADVRVVPAASGTAANALALAALAGNGERILCHEAAHIRVAEEGAPEFYVRGAGCQPLPGAHGRIDPVALSQALDGKRGIISLTQVTEFGTVYRSARMADLTRPARAAGMATHLDGARFANAVASLDCPPAAITTAAGIDALALGSSKNGTLNAEAVVFFDTALAEALGPMRKRSGHAYSKMRYLSAQLEAWFANGLWLRLAHHANTMASRLAEGLANLAGVKLLSPVEANMVFVEMPSDLITRLQGKGFPLEPRKSANMVRLVPSFATTGYRSEPGRVQRGACVRRDWAPRRADSTGRPRCKCRSPGCR